METKHTAWLDSIATLITADTAGAGPYNTAFSYDPDYDLSNFQDKIDSFIDTIDVVEPILDYETFLAAAASAVDASLEPDTYIDEATVAYESAQLPPYFRSINRFTGPMSDLNAVHTSAFVIGMAIMEQSFQNNVDGFAAQLKVQRSQIRATAILDGVRSIMQLFNFELQGDLNIAQLQGDFAYKAIGFKTNQYEQDLAIDVHDIMWDYDVFMRGGEMLGSISGAAAGPLKTPRGQQMLSGGLSGIASLATTLGTLGVL